MDYDNYATITTSFPIAVSTYGNYYGNYGTYGNYEYGSSTAGNLQTIFVPTMDEPDRNGFVLTEEAWDRAIREYLSRPIGAIQFDEVAEETEADLVADPEELDRYLDEFAIRAS